MTGMVIRNAACQLNVSMPPPTMGPTAAPTDAIAAHTAIAQRRCCRPRNMLRTKDKVDGIMIAPPTPRSARAPMSIHGVVARAPTTDAIVKTTEPMSRFRLRSNRSPTVLIATSRPASRCRSSTAARCLSG